jgi:GNAT superfamily N-acetyltransferase
MSEIKIRAAKMADEKAILALAEAEMAAHVRMDERFRLREDANNRYAVYLRDRMRDIDSSVFVAEDGDRILGLTIGTVRRVDSFFAAQRFGYISDLMVDPSARRRGIGRALYERTVLWLQGLGVGVVRLHVAVKSDEARAFWRSVGAQDFLVEAWIDLAGARGDAQTAVAAAHASPAAPAAAEAEPVRPRSGFDYPGDALAGPEGSG